MSSDKDTDIVSMPRWVFKMLMEDVPESPVLFTPTAEAEE